TAVRIRTTRRGRGWLVGCGGGGAPMIALLSDFIDSWRLFAHTYLSGWLIAIALAQLGCLVVARNQAFLGAAVAQASAAGVALAMVLGVALGVSIASAGTLYSFGCLVLPALIARSWCRTLASMFLVAPAIALVATISAFIWANGHDLPPGQLAVAMLGGLLVI